MRIFLLAGLVVLAACQASPPSPTEAPGNDSAEAAKDAPLGAVVDPASAGSATEVATQYADAISAGRLAEAFGLLAPGSEAAGDGAASFAAHFAERRSIAMTIGKAGDTVSGDDLRLVEVPAILTGIDQAGTPFRVEGPILLRVADKSATPDIPPHWQIVRTPFPA